MKVNRSIIEVKPGISKMIIDNRVKVKRNGGIVEVKPGISQLVKNKN